MSEIIINGQSLATYLAGITATPSGAMMDFGGAVAPSGWLPCDGTAVNRVTFAALFAAIGTIWGPGDGSTTFNVPDFRRRTSVGSGGAGTGTLGSSVGNTGGEESHVLTTAELASHTHTASGTHNHNTNSNGSTVAATGTSPTPLSTSVPAGGTQSILTYSSSSSSAGMVTSSNGSGITNSSTGSDTAHNNIQPSAVVLKIIKT